MIPRIHHTVDELSDLLAKDLAVVPTPSQDACDVPMPTPELSLCYFFTPLSFGRKFSITQIS